MIRKSFLIIGILSLIYGLIFFLIPDWFINLSKAENTNIAWLRNIGASIVGILFFGNLFIFLQPSGKIHLLRIILITSFLQTLALIYSRIFNEFSAKSLIIIDLTILLAIIVTIYLFFINFYKINFFK
tara:strand:- start:68 stop:451 length:384 start_codon:yes stop_codon:yes gene_type:complete